jgi:hypothetical protein
MVIPQVEQLDILHRVIFAVFHIPVSFDLPSEYLLLSRELKNILNSGRGLAACARPMATSAHDPDRPI